MFNFIRDFKISTKILIFMTINLIVSVAIIGMASYSLMGIGKKITEIAEEDIPLTAIVADITIKQLEQAINFERALRYAGVMTTDDEFAREHYETAVHHFEELTHEVDKEILEGEKMVEGFIATTSDAALLKEFHHVDEALKRIETEHADFEHHVEQVFALIEEGRLLEAEELSEKIEIEEEQLDHELEALTAELQKFTLEAAHEAETLEATALKAMVIGFAIAMSLVFIMMFISKKLISLPLRASINALIKLSEGDTSIELEANSKDEVGDIIRALMIFKDRDKLAAETSVELKATAESLASGAEETTAQSASVATAIDQAAGNIQTVAAASEELSISIKEISSQITDSDNIAKGAVDEANQAHDAINELAEASEKIGAVVKMITDIAEQTNLLALNATIEAARAGDAGKGFAVVASEVKNLASQTAEATENIAGQVSNIQAKTEGAVKSIGNIVDTINQINVISAEVLSSIDTQSMAICEIAENAQQAATGTTEVSANIEGVQTSAVETSSTATQVLSIAEKLSSNIKSDDSISLPQDNIVDIPATKEVA